MSGSQKFIARNRAPRVQIEYDVELYGSEKKVQLPFVMGVLSDLSGKSEKPAVADRKFLEIDADSFDDRMQAMAPRASFTVPNTLTGEGNLTVDLTFEKMSDFSPEAIASKVQTLAPLLEARRQLSDLMAYMDGKSGAEALIETLLNKTGLLQALSGEETDQREIDAALASLKSSLTEPEAKDDATEKALASLAGKTVETPPNEPSHEDVLSTLQDVPEEVSGLQASDTLADALDTLRESALEETAEEDETASVLSDLAKAAPQTNPESSDLSDDVLATIERVSLSEEDDDTDNILASIDVSASEENTGPHIDDILSSVEGQVAPAEETSSAGILEDLKETTPEFVDEPDTTDSVLASLETQGVSEAEDTGDGLDNVLQTLDTEPAADAHEDSLDDILAALEMPEPDEVKDDDSGDLEALLGDLTDTEPSDPVEDDLEDLLGDLGSDEPDEDDAASESSELDTDLDDLLSELGAADVGEPPPDEVGGLEDLLADLTSDADDLAQGDDGDLDALLADLEAPPTGGEDGEDLAALLDDPSEAVEVPETPSAPPSPFGTISVPKPDAEDMKRKKFRMALFGDFSGRSARGEIEIGDALAAREAIELDIDTVEDVISRFATTLTLPIGKDGGGIEVKLGELDDLHPDELFENVEIFEAISGLRQQLGVGSMAGRVAEQLKDWGAQYDRPVHVPARSAATSVPPNLKLTDFQALIRDTSGALSQPTPVDNLIARVVGPYVVKAPDAGAAEMLAAVDDALSGAMRLVLHHPDFQAVESQWRSLDFLARRIETDSTLEIVLYDVSAEELAADLAAQDDLSDSGLLRLLTIICV